MSPIERELAEARKSKSLRIARENSPEDKARKSSRDPFDVRWEKESKDRSDKRLSLLENAHKQLSLERAKVDTGKSPLSSPMNSRKGK